MWRFSRLFLVFSSVLLAQKSSLPEGSGKEVVQRICVQCHAVEIFTAKGNTRDGWTQVVTEMIARGAQGSDDDFGAIVDYLTTHFPPKVDIRINVNKADSAQLHASLGISDKDATAIVDYRRQHGDFKSLDELKRVPEIDSARLDSLKDKITF